MSFKQQILDFYNLDEATYQAFCLPAKWVDLPLPTTFTDMDKVTARILAAITNNEKIVIYGDYDCDGVMATSILVSALRKLNAQVGYYLPSRYLDGYGLNPKKVEEFKAKDYSLIITVDNGIAQNEAIDKANDLGIDVIVTDHHQVLDVLPHAYAILHPSVSGYGDVISCGAYVSFMLASALLGYYDEYYATLAMTATISDMMELTSYNRTITRLGLEALNKHNYPQFNLLANTSLYDEKTISFSIAPKINAIGRMLEKIEINQLVTYFTTDDLPTIKRTAYWINKVNDDRKSSMNAAFENKEEVNLNDPALIVFTNEKEGLIGLLAARYLNTYDKPTVVFKEDTKNPDVLKGSARSRSGFSIAKAFQSMSELFISYGGHGAAGGCSLLKENLVLFKEKFNALALEYIFDIEEENAIIIKDINEFNFENYNFLAKLKPFGVGFPAPQFKLERLPTSIFSWGKAKTHIITSITKDFKIIGWNLDYELFLSSPYVDLIGELEVNIFKEVATLQYSIKSYLNRD